MHVHDMQMQLLLLDGLSAGRRIRSYAAMQGFTKLQDTDTS